MTKWKSSQSSQILTHFLKLAFVDGTFFLGADFLLPSSQSSAFGFAFGFGFSVVLSTGLLVFYILFSSLADFDLGEPNCDFGINAAAAFLFILIPLDAFESSDVVLL